MFLLHFITLATFNLFSPQMDVKYIIAVGA